MLRSTAESGYEERVGADDGYSYLEGVSDSEIRIPVKKVIIKDGYDSKTAAIACADIKLECERNLEFVLQSKDAVHTKLDIFAKIPWIIPPPFIVVPIPGRSNDATATNESIEAFGEMAFVHQVGI